MADCARRCTELTAGLDENCAECMRDSMEFQHDADEACSLAPPRVFVGLTGTCALRHCDVPYICYMPASCGDDSRCVRPCLVEGGGTQWGFCTFPDQGTCECESDIVTVDNCNNTGCLCPSCGTGTGLCLTEDQRERVCLEGYVEQYAEAQARFACDG